MRVNFTGCAVCDSTWGEVWAEVEGTPLFFCCAICHRQLVQLVDHTKRRTGWPRVESLEIQGDRQGRTALLRCGEDQIRVRVAFNAQGEVRRFDAFDPSTETPPLPS